MSTSAESLDVRPQWRRDLEDRFAWLQVRMALSKSQTRVEIYERFLTFTSEGIPLEHVLRVLLANAREAKSPWAVFWQRVAEDHINETVPFATALGQHMPAAERVMLSVGETSGKWETGFTEALFVCKSAGRIASELKNALMYPVLLLLALVAVIVIASIEIAPQMTGMLDRPLDEWPFASYVLFRSGEILTAQGWLIALAAVAVVWGVMGTLGRWEPYAFGEVGESYGRKPLYAILAAIAGISAAGWFFGVFGVLFALGAVAALMAHPRWREHVRGGLDQTLPPWTIYREYQASSLLIALSALVRAGRPIDAAIRDIMRIANPWLRAHLDKSLERIMGSESSGTSFATGLMSRDVSQYMLDFDKMGQFRKCLDAVGIRGVDRAIARVAAQAGTLRLVLIILVVSVMGFVYVGIMQPGYLLYSESQQGGAIR